MNRNFNIEIFKHFRFEAVSEGKLKCPIKDCEMAFDMMDNEETLSNELKYSIRNQMYESHSDSFERLVEKYSIVVTFISREQKIDKAFELVAIANGKINQILSKLSTNKINGQETIHQIAPENKKLENMLIEVLMCPSTTPKQHTTSPLGSL
ncbi:unnamed protein product [Rotaria magnacalcarata]|uniref:Uncharacterized protein n=1 Tax=Rotaria magnacalcarata TaxID=392030 RepID=A0A816VG45_9BILA|nr:unnamed protein product [Rotaria magnacalcarata]CAF2120624.1 unnamed protein product [Rotaria magnacalcarata]CAF2122542.1 unnamed protein product [Rotaria magnacalcarata]CAF3808192.1 unnamed protein product [Rotaria magnacalcarata]CAF3849557.1 unnamed protein product [Rotaria magnacalcarata]